MSKFEDILEKRLLQKIDIIWSHCQSSKTFFITIWQINSKIIFFCEMKV